jgi:N-hydroxyarylamine O-acetyltransferase
VKLDDGARARYLDRIGANEDLSLHELQRLHVNAIPYENLDVRLGRDVQLDIDSLVAKLVDQRRGGYCFELNTLFAALLESLGHEVTRCLARVRLGDPTAPRPETHMVLLVDGSLVDVGFGGATPIGPLPLGGSASFGPWTWYVESTRSPEGDEVWSVRLADLALFTVTTTPKHEVDFLAPNHWTSTHPMSLFRNATIVQRWADDTQVGLIGTTLTFRRPDFSDDSRAVDLADLGTVLVDEFGLELGRDDIEQLAAQLRD